MMSLGLLTANSVKTSVAATGVMSTGKERYGTVSRRLLQRVRPRFPKVSRHSNTTAFWTEVSNKLSRVDSTHHNRHLT